VEGRVFIPEQTLYELMTRTFVSDVCSSCGVPLHQIEEIIEVIMYGARKVFAVLILISEELSILRFIENDQFSKSRLDDKIPFSMDILNVIDQAIAPVFLRQQWELSAPSFPGAISHRVLDKNIILPFIKEKQIGEGSFGVIYEVVLHPSSHSFQELPEEVSILNLAPK
jgi:hypothetical protein